MIFTKRLRDGVREGRITCVRIWKAPHVKPGGRYVDAIRQIALGDINGELARSSGFDGL